MKLRLIDISRVVKPTQNAQWELMAVFTDKHLIDMEYYRTRLLGFKEGRK